MIGAVVEHMDEFMQCVKLIFGGDKNDIVLIDAAKNEPVYRSVFTSTASELALVLKEMNVHEVMVCADNCVELAVFYFAAMLGNVTVIAIDPEKTEAEINGIREIHSHAAFYDAFGLESLLSEARSRGTSGDAAWNAIDFIKPWLITYTSGSTGTPKGVIHSAGNLFAAAYEFGRFMRYDKNTVMGHCMPMTYMAGILNTLIMPVLFGGCVVILNRFSMKSAFSFWKDVESFKVNTLWLSPTMLRIANMTDSRGDMKSYFHENKMKVSIGTAPLDIQLREDFELKYGIRLYQSYGLSETLFISTESIDEQESGHTVGRILPSVNLEFAEDGEIIIGVPWIFLGYTNANVDEYLISGQYVSGDLGRITGNGNLLITGRKKELIVRGGYNINPRDIENLLIAKHYADECIVLPVLRKGEEQIACCYVSSRSLSRTELNKDVIKDLGSHFRIDFLEKRESLPRNLNGKVDRPRLRKELEGQYDS